MIKNSQEIVKSPLHFPKNNNESNELSLATSLEGLCGGGGCGGWMGLKGVQGTGEGSQKVGSQLQIRHGV